MGKEENKKGDEERYCIYFLPFWVGNKYKEGERMRHHSPLICLYHLPSYTVSHLTILQSWLSLP